MTAMPTTNWSWAPPERPPEEPREPLFALPVERPFTVDDLAGLPDDGRRYELVEGALLVSPAPTFRHQKVVARLVVHLDAACPEGMHVLPAPFAVRASADTEVQPDVLVAREEDLTETMLPVAPVLVVEVLSRSTGLIDLTAKKALYQRMGVPSYWVVDAVAPEGLRLVVFEPGESGEYEVVADVKEHAVFEAVRPFPVRLVLAELLGSQRSEQAAD